MKILDHNGRPITRERAPAPGASYYQNFAATQHSRYRSEIPSAVQDASKDIPRGERRLLIGFARWLERNSGLVRGAFGDMARYAIGPGLVPQPLVEDKSVAREYADYFHEWAKVADVTGEFTFWEMQRLASVRMDIDGDVGFLKVGKPGEFPMIQPVESHLIDDEKDAYRHDSPEGVQTFANGRVKSYTIKSGKGFRKVRGPDLMLVMERQRVGQKRGFSSFAHAIDHIRDETDLFDYEKVGVKMNSAIGVAITTMEGNTDDGRAIIENGYQASADRPVPISTWSAGMAPHLKPNEKIESFASNRPSPTFNGFIEAILRKVCIGLGVPYEFLVAPANQGTASRFILEKAQRRFDERANLIECRFCARTWEWVIARGIQSGSIPFADRWWRAKWHRPKKVTVDAGRDAKANEASLKLGTRTLAEDAAERGTDWKDLRAQVEAEAEDLLARAKSLAGRHDISLDAAISLLSQRTPNPVFQSASTD